jgi:hypothetical protein
MEGALASFIFRFLRRAPRNRWPLSYSVDFFAVSRSFTVPGEEYIPLQGRSFWES